MSYGPFVSIPPGYCFIPSCPAKPNAPSSTSIHTVSFTTSTTTIIGPTITTPLHHSKRTPATDDDVRPVLGTQPFGAFPTDAAIPVGPGPICIVHCDWAKMQNAGETLFRPAIRPTSVDEMMMTTSTMMTVSKATMTVDDDDVTSTSSSSTTRTSAQPTSSSPPFPPHRLSAADTAGIIVCGLAGLALLLVAIWFIVRKIRNVRARLNQRNQGVLRDREREIYEQDGGKGIPEIGGVALADIHQKV
ncbi:MAG: hypothetical protein Q9224_006704 [Gallowayella concinna]